MSYYHREANLDQGSLRFSSNVNFEGRWVFLTLSTGGDEECFSFFWPDLGVVIINGVLGIVFFAAKALESDALPVGIP